MPTTPSGCVTCPQKSRGDHVGQQARDRHGTHAARHGRDPAGAPRGRLVFHIADQLARQRCGLFPTSNTAAPGRIQSPGTKPALPTAATTTSARSTSARKSRVPVWQTVTVAPASNSSSAMGRPTMLEAPTTVARSRAADARTPGPAESRRRACPGLIAAVSAPAARCCSDAGHRHP